MSLRVAAIQAQKSTCRSQHGAVISRRNSVLSVGRNSYKPHPTFGSGPLLTLHAEAAAIRAALSNRINMTGCTIYVVRLKKGKLSLSMPCTACQRLIDKYKMKARWSL